MMDEHNLELRDFLLEIEDSKSLSAFYSISLVLLSTYSR